MLIFNNSPFRGPGGQNKKMYKSEFSEWTQGSRFKIVPQMFHNDSKLFRVQSSKFKVVPQ